MIRAHTDRLVTHAQQVNAHTRERLAYHQRKAAEARAARDAQQQQQAQQQQAQQ